MHNPQVLTLTQLQMADTHEIVVDGYMFLVASVSLAFSLLFFYWLFKFLVWFLPHYWNRAGYR